jgi:Thioesterase-like superfamily
MNPASGGRPACGSVRAVQHSVFYEPSGPGTFTATSATVGPWNADSQHGGPPSALAAHAIENCQPDPAQRLASVAVDILRPVPIGKLTVRSRVVRPGRRVALVEAVLEAGGQELLRARGWRIAIAAAPELPGGAPARMPAIPEPEPTPATPYPGAPAGGYMSAMDWRYVAGGGLDTPGPSVTWVRPRIPLLPGEELSPMCRALLIADSGNGLSAVLDPGKFLFINVDLQVSLHRDPEGEWLLVDAATSVGPSGTGLASTTLSDPTGPCGRGAQTLLIAAR